MVLAHRTRFIAEEDGESNFEISKDVFDGAIKQQWVIASM